MTTILDKKLHLKYTLLLQGKIVPFTWQLHFKRSFCISSRRRNLLTGREGGLITAGGRRRGQVGPPVTAPTAVELRGP